MFAVIFDFDGTIFDSESIEFESHRRLFEEYGLTLTETDWCEGVGLLKPDTHWYDRLCAGASDPLDFASFRERTRTYFSERVRFEPMPGIAPLLGALVAAGVPRAVASTAPADWVLRGLEGLRLAPTFDAIVTGDQVRRLKPAPDVYLEAARRLGIEPAACVAIEDSGPGVASARAAGMKTVAVPHPLTRTHDFSGVDISVESAEELTLEMLRALVASSA